MAQDTTNQQSNNNQQQQNQNTPARPSRYGSGTPNQQNNNSNQQQQQQQQNNRPSTPPRFGSNNPFRNRNNNELNWMIIPLQKTVVRFELKGLGDPFYKLLGHDLNEELAENNAILKTLEEGGQAVDDLCDLLEKRWEGYKLNGAALVYQWGQKSWTGIAKPQPMPVPFDNFLDDSDDDNEEKKEPEQEPPFKVLMSIDLALVINVLARARTQLLLAQAPMVFSRQYMNRSLVTDDPQLVKLVQATGYLEVN